MNRVSLSYERDVINLCTHGPIIQIYQEVLYDYNADLHGIGNRSLL